MCEINIKDNILYREIEKRAGLHDAIEFLERHNGKERDISLE